MQPYLAMLPRLDAAGQMADIAAAQFPYLKKAEQRRTANRLKKQAGMRRRARKPTRGDLAALGVNVEEA